MKYHRPITSLATFLATGALLALVIFGREFFLSPLDTVKRHQIAAGHNALFLCSGHFIAGRDEASIMAQEIAFATPRFSAKSNGGYIEEDSQTAIGWSGWGLFRRRAAYRPGMGCTLMGPGWSLEQIADLPYVDMPMLRGDPNNIDWPMGDRLPDTPLPANVDMESLNTVLDRAFDGRSYAEHDLAWKDDTKTFGVVVVYKGRIIAERYAPDRDLHTQYRTYSAAKSFSNALAGIMVQQGKLDIDAPLPFPQWREPGSGKESITVRHLLHMSSGLTCGNAFGHSIMVYFGGGLSIAQEGMARDVVAPPGKRWCYENFDTNLIVYAVRVILNDEEKYLSFPRRMLLNKLGMRDTYPETDAFGNFIMSSQIWTTPRDLARFGLLYLHDGVWPYGENAGERILPEGWVDFSRSRAPAFEDEEGEMGYGAQFWLFDNHPRLPPDTFSAAGHQDQMSTIVASRNVVVVRTGLMYWDHLDFVADILEAIDKDK